MKLYEDLKNEIEQRTGVPASLLSGETPEELLSQTKALLAYRKSKEEEQPKSVREQFADWMNACNGIQPQDTAEDALADIEKTVMAGYPRVQDGSADQAQPASRSARDQFAEWFKQLR